MSLDIDIAICGAGPVGLACAAMLVRRGVAAQRIALIDALPHAQAAADPRALAVSWGSRQLLDDIGAWPHAAHPIHDIHVSRRGCFGRTVITREEYGIPALGYVARYGALVDSLAGSVAGLGIPVLRPARLTALEEGEHDGGVVLRLDDGRIVNAAVAVQAEGGLFAAQQAKSLHRDYGQTAVVSHVHVSRPVAYRAFERFTDEGPLALLPQGDAHGAPQSSYALVWCARPATAERLLNLPETEFLAALHTAFGDRLGRFVRAAPRRAYPLGLNAQPASSARLVAIGNAAQTLHPVAGQGFNLGLRDAAVLARLLAHAALHDMAPYSLSRFAAERQADRNLTISLTDAMARLFAVVPGGVLSSFSQQALGLSLGALDFLKPAKRLLAQQMLFGRR